MSKPLADGAYVHQRLNFVTDGKAHRRNAKTSNRTWEIPPSGIIGGLHIGAPEFYPNQGHVKQLEKPSSPQREILWSRSDL